MSDLTFSFAPFFVLGNRRNFSYMIMEDIFKKIVEADNGVRLGSCDIENLCAEGGKTLAGIGRGSGAGRLKKALAEARRAIDGVQLEACHGIAVCLFVGSNVDDPLRMDELEPLREYLSGLPSPVVDNVKWKLSFDDKLGDSVEIAIIVG